MTCKVCGKEIGVGTATVRAPRKKNWRGKDVRGKVTEVITLEYCSRACRDGGPVDEHGPPSPPILAQPDAETEAEDLPAAPGVVTP